MSNNSSNNFSKRSSIAGDRPYSQHHYNLRTHDHYNLFSGNRSQPTQPRVTTEPHQASFSSAYESRYPVYGLDWATTRDSELSKIALSSFREDATNKLKIIYGTPNYLNEEDMTDRSLIDSWTFDKGYDVTVNYPVTRLQWDPSMVLGYSNKDRLATSSECLRIYEVEAADLMAPITTSSNIRGNQNKQNEVYPGKLVEKMALTNSKSKNFSQLPPLTSFDWNYVDPKHIITCSIDTTCTLWDLSRGSGVAKTQLIAHDSEVFDVKFLFGDKYVFTSCSNDGSIRVFDLRSLEHSTIIYEPLISRPSIASQSATPSSSAGPEGGPGMSNRQASFSAPQPTPLLKLATSNYNANHIAAIEARSNRVLILDLRYPGTPIKTLQHHSAAVNSLAWHPTKNLLASGSDDCQVLIHDLNSSDNNAVTVDQNNNASAGVPNDMSGEDDFPKLGFFDDMEINNVCWSSEGDWIGINSGRRMQAVKLEP